MARKYKPLQDSKKNQYKEEGDNGKGKDSNTGNNIYFFNFSLPAIVTCPNAPTACTGYKYNIKQNANETVCFSRRVETRWRNGKNHVEINHYKNLLFTLENNYNSFSKFMSDPKRLNYPIPEIPLSINNILPSRHIVKNPECVIDQYTYDSITKHAVSKALLEDDFSEKCIKINSKDFFVENRTQLIWKRFLKINLEHRSDMYIRIHHSGDFYNQTYFEKWVKIALKLEAKLEQRKKETLRVGSLQLMAYTKEVRMIENFLISNTNSNNNPILNAENDPVSTLDDIPIKLVFSEMQNDKFYKTPSRDIFAYETLKDIKNMYRKRVPFMKYTVVGGSDNKQTNCLLDQGKLCYQCLACYEKMAAVDKIIKER